MIRLIIPDSHGQYIDPKARKAFLEDVKILDPKETVWLGDHLDVSGVFSNHPAQYVKDLEYSYEKDCEQANNFLNAVQDAAPNCTSHHMMEGNHEQHWERWAVKTFSNKEDASSILKVMGPQAKLHLKNRGIKFYRFTEFHQGLAIPGAMRLGKCFFTHGTRAGMHATAQHLSDFGANVTHGHVHRSASVIRRTAAAGEIGAWCPGTLSLLQPTYLHNSVSSWSHGYAIQLVEKDGRFLHINVPIVNGKSLLSPLLKELNPNKLMGNKR